MRDNDDYPNVNAARQIPDTESVLSYWKRCLKFRREHKDVFIYGDFEIIDPEDKDVVAFRRYSDSDSFVTVTNFTYLGLNGSKVSEWLVGNYELETHNKSLGTTLSLRP
ncbi:hypothetical protein E4T38_06107 [Aureobasidium subglaciale]|nr:hypothetical protein E4T38_06107 [Aureobasidium subglaciale]KAI5219918.1 hypothetical protein E4T40_06128 [Aureobasidium subglaciale]KAI5223659.1 hypothetical protein E4T41_06069 [Aureobasidium subglaciale]KAI5260540.1 hypothetical protein E4T46_05862 [Aureobasidium subglaciale]